MGYIRESSPFKRIRWNIALNFHDLPLTDIYITFDFLTDTREECNTSLYIS